LARGRMISKAISLDEKVGALSDDTARLLFTWMIPHLDCEGRMYGEAQVFKSIVAPRRNYSAKKVEKYLVELEKFGLIDRYTINGNAYISVKNFEKHQIGLQKDKEAQSQIPPFTPELIQSKDRVTLIQEKRSLREENKEIYKEKSLNKNNYGEFKNILLTEDELKKLNNRLGVAKTDDLVERLSAYKKSKGKVYKDDYATILNWSRRDASNNKPNPRSLPKEYAPDGS